MVDRVEHVRALWTYPAKEEIFTIAITDDGRFIFAGGDEVLYCFEQAGNLIWSGRLEGIALSITLAEGSSHLVVACANGKAYIWNYQGSLVQVLDLHDPISGLSITPTGHRIALGTLKGKLYLYDITGRELWQHTLPSVIRGLMLATDGNMLVLGCEDGGVYCFDAQGAIAWNFFARDRVWAGATLSSSCVLAGSDDQHVYCLDRSGHLLWRFHTGTMLNRIVLTADGEVAAAGGNNERVWVWQQDGTLRWESAIPGAVTGLAIAQDGHFVVVATSNHAVMLFDERGQRLWTQQMQDKVYAVSITVHGRLIAAVAADHTLSLVENQLVSADADQKGRERVIRQLRQHSLTNQHVGMALWFTRFDRALLERQFALCERLLEELHEGGYHLEEEEQRWLAQREGLFWFYQGMHYQQQRQEEQARQAYECSKERLHQLHHGQGEGQALMALKMLDDHQSERDPGWLTLLTSLPEATGNSELLLTHRIQKTQEMADQYQLVLTAQQLGYLQPLLAALSSPHTLVQATAAAALPWLQPGPSSEVLLDLLLSHHWIVRWQSLLMLTQRARQQPRVLAPYRERMRRRLIAMVEHESDPAVLRSLIVLLRSIGDAILASSLLPFLHDPDLEVRLEAVLTLKIIGTRAVLPELRQVCEGKTALERLVNDWAALARQDIRQRIPLAQVQQVVCCSELARPVPTDTFVTYNPEVHCIVTLTQITAGLRVRCTLTTERQEPIEQEVQLGIHSLHHEEQPDARQSLRDWLYRLLAEEDLAFWSWREDEDELNQNGIAEQGKEVVFSFAPDRRIWFPGIYTVQIALNDIVAHKCIFKVVSREAALYASHYYRKGAFFQRRHYYQEALLDYEQTLKFDAYHIKALCHSADIWLIRGSLQTACETYLRAFRLDANTVLNHVVTDGIAHVLAVNCLEEMAATLLPLILGSLDPQLLQNVAPRVPQLSKALLLWLFEGKAVAMDALALLVQAPGQELGDRFACLFALALLGRREEGLALVEQIPALTNNAVARAVLQACALTLLRQEDAALSALDTALFEHHAVIVLHSVKALIYLSLQQQEEALNMLEQAVSLNPDSLLLLCLKGLVLFQLQKKEQMMRCCQSIIAFHADLALAYLLNAAAFVLLREYEEALTWIAAVLKRDSDNVPASILAIYTLIQLGRNEQAQQRCEQITARFPTLPLERLLRTGKITLDK